MKKNIVLIMLSFVVFFIIYLIIWKIMKFSFENMNEPIRAIICGGLTAVLSPRITNYKTQFGNTYQLVWIVFRKAINL